MWTYILSTLVCGFGRTWKLYLANTVSVMVVILLIAYLDGSRRQLNIQNSVFSGDLVVRFDTPVHHPDSIITSAVKPVEYISRKLRKEVAIKVAGSRTTVAATIIGVDLASDAKLSGFLSLTAGRLPQSDREILVPSSLSGQLDIAIGGTVTVMGQTSDRLHNTALFTIAGIYNAPGLNLTTSPRIIAGYTPVAQFMQPRGSDVEHCLFFKNSVIPGDINKTITALFPAGAIESIESKQISMWDVQNISVQFNVFLVIMILLMVVVIATVVILVNFNIFTVLFRKRQREIGTLMAFGVQPGTIALTLFLESLLQILFSTSLAVLLCLLLAAVADRHITGGFMEVFLILLSGTNRLDLLVQVRPVLLCFVLLFTAVSLSQISIFLKVLLYNPIVFMEKKR